MASWLLLVHLAATGYLTGLVWFVQAVHYPMLAGLPAAELPGLIDRNRSLTFWVVAPAMLLEAATGVLLLMWRPTAIPRGLVLAGLSLLAVVWGLTFLVLVPLHEALAGGYDVGDVQRLIDYNWPRVGAWSLRLLLVLWMGRLTLRCPLPR